MDAKQQTQKSIDDALDGVPPPRGMVKIKPLRDQLGELLHLRGAKDDAAEAFADAVKSVAKLTGLYPSVVKNLVKAKATDSMGKMSREVSQLAMVFDEFGKSES